MQSGMFLINAITIPTTIITTTTTTTIATTTTNTITTTTATTGTTLALRQLYVNVCKQAGPFQKTKTMIGKKVEK